MCSEKFRKFHWKTDVLESLFSKDTGCQALSFIKKSLRCIPVRSEKFLRTPMMKNIWELPLMSELPLVII